MQLNWDSNSFCKNHCSVSSLKKRKFESVPSLMYERFSAVCQRVIYRGKWEQDIDFSFIWRTVAVAKYFVGCQ